MSYDVGHTLQHTQHTQSKARGGTWGSERWGREGGVSEGWGKEGGGREDVGEPVTEKRNEAIVSCHFKKPEKNDKSGSTYTPYFWSVLYKYTHIVDENYTGLKKTVTDIYLLWPCGSDVVQKNDQRARNNSPVIGSGCRATRSSITMETGNTQQ